MKTEKSLKVMGNYNSKVELKELFETHDLKISFEYKVLYYDRKM